MTTECGEYEKIIEIPLASCEYVHKRKPRTLKKSKFIQRFNALLKRETKSDNVSAQASSAEEAEERKSLKLSCEDCASCDCGERVLNAEEKSEERKQNGLGREQETGRFSGTDVLAICS